MEHIHWNLVRHNGHDWCEDCRKKREVKGRILLTHIPPEERGRLRTYLNRLKVSFIINLKGEYKVSGEEWKLRKIIGDVAEYRDLKRRRPR